MIKYLLKQQLLCLEFVLVIVVCPNAQFKLHKICETFKNFASSKVKLSFFLTFKSYDLKRAVNRFCLKYWQLLR